MRKENEVENKSRPTNRKKIVLHEKKKINNGKNLKYNNMKNGSVMKKGIKYIKVTLNENMG